MRPMKLTMLPLETDNVIRVRCEGNVVLCGLSAATDPLQQLLGPNCFAHKVVINLSQAQGVDTSGVAWLVRTADRFAQVGGRFVILGVPPMVQQILHILGLSSYFRTATTDDEARDLALRYDAGHDDHGGRTHPNGNGVPEPFAPSHS
jgi:anti-anti-sigma factor